MHIIRRRFFTAFTLLFLMAVLQPCWSQCSVPVKIVRDSGMVACTQINVSTYGSVDTFNYCQMSPYWIGKFTNAAIKSGAYTFTFSPPVNGVTLDFSALSHSPTYYEEIHLFVNGSHYFVPNRGVSGCDSLAIITPQGNIAPCNMCNGAGWLNTYIPGSISTLTVLDSVFYGSPAGSVFSLFICPSADSSISPHILGNDTILCLGESMDLVATSPDITSYLWSTGETDSSIHVAQTGNYWVKMETSCGFVIDTVKVRYKSAPNINLGPDDTLCPGTTTALIPNFPGATYEWQDYSTDSVFIVTAPGTYTIKASNECGISYDTVYYDYYNPFTVLLGNDTTVCSGDVLRLNAYQAGASYRWPDNSSGAYLDVDTSGMFWVEVNMNDCIEEDTIQVAYLEKPRVDFGNDTALCQGQTLRLDATVQSGVYIWENSSGNPVRDIVSGGTYSVSAVNACGLANDVIVVTFDAYPLLNLGPDTLLCDGDTLHLDVTQAGLTYAWQDGSTTSFFNVVASGTYHVSASRNNCSSTDTVTAVFNPLPLVFLGNDTGLCDGVLLTLQAGRPRTSSVWQNNSTDSFLVVSKPGIYWVKTTAINCSATDSIEVSYPDRPLLTNDTVICPDEEMVLSANKGGVLFLWSNGATDTFLRINMPGTYWSQLTLSGCTFTDTVNVEWKTNGCNCLLTIPRAFSPNRDGLNDVFHPVTNCPPFKYRMLVYNRWGQVVFESTDMSTSWDGTHNGEPLPTDVYLFQVTYALTSGDGIEAQSGTVLLLR